MKILFVCSRNRIRSLTAERLMSKTPGYQVRSAGIAASARVRVSERHIDWADIIFVMEPRHSDVLRIRFGERLGTQQIHCLDIPDAYDYMSEELVTALRVAIGSFLDPDPFTGM